MTCRETHEKGQKFEMEMEHDSVPTLVNSSFCSEDQGTELVMGNERD